MDDDDDDGDETSVVGRGEPRRGRVRGDRGDVCAECVMDETNDGRDRCDGWDDDERVDMDDDDARVAG